MSREQDEQIAEKLFGWKWMAFDGIPIKGTSDYPRKQRVRQFLSGKQLKSKRWREHMKANEGAPAIGDEPLSYTHCSSGCTAEMIPPYTSDAGADYLVLCQVREHWTHEQNQAFVEELKTLRWPRCNVSQPFSLELFAEPGDYSRAALAVLAQEQPDAIP